MWPPTTLPGLPSPAITPKEIQLSESIKTGERVMLERSRESVDVRPMTNSKPLAFIFTCALALGACREDPNSRLRLSEGMRLSAEVGVRLENDLLVHGGTPPFVFEVRNGLAFWPGLSLSPEGRVSGTPTEPGQALIALVVTDAEGHQADGAIALEVRDRGVLRGSEACESPEWLWIDDPSSSLQLVTGRFPAAGEGALYYALQLPELARVRISSTPTTELRIASEACAADVGPPSSAIDMVLGPGPVGLSVKGMPGTTFTLVIQVESPDSDAACPFPQRLALALGTQTITLVSPTLLPNQNASSCGGERTGELAFAFELFQSSEVELRLRSGANGPVALATGSCQGPELACRRSYEPVSATLGPGTYVFIIEGVTEASVEVEASLFEAAQRPANDRCETAEPIDLSTGSLTLRGDFGGALPDFLDCGEDHPLYYVFDLAETSDLEIQSDDSIQSAIGPPECGSITSCGGGAEGCVGPLEPGRHVLRLTPSGSAVRDFEALVRARARPSPTPPSNDACSDAQVLALGPGVHQLEANMIGATNENPWCQLATPEVFYRLDLSVRSDIRFSGSTVSVLEAGCATTAQCATSGSMLYGRGPGSIWFAVLGNESGERGPRFDGCYRTPEPEYVEITIENSPPPPPNLSCGSAEVVSFPAALDVELIQGTTRGADLRSDPACDALGPERPVVVYALDFDATSRWRFTNPAAAYNIDLRLNAVCDSPTALFCSEFNGRLETSSALPAGRYFLHVSTEQPADFTLLVEQLPP